MAYFQDPEQCYSSSYALAVYGALNLECVAIASRYDRNIGSTLTPYKNRDLVGQRRRNTKNLPGTDPLEPNTENFKI